MQHTSNRWGKRLAILLPLLAVVGVLAWYLREVAKPTSPADEVRTIVLDVAPGGIVWLDPSDSGPPGDRASLVNKMQVRMFLKRIYQDPASWGGEDEQQKGPRVRFVIQALEGANPAEVEAVSVMCVEEGFKDIEVRPAVQ
jgi:hypothetical protein